VASGPPCAPSGLRARSAGRRVARRRTWRPLFDGGQHCVPFLAVDADSVFHVGVGQVQAGEVQRMAGRHETDRGFDGVGFAFDARDGPLEDTGVVAEAGPGEAAVGRAVTVATSSWIVEPTVDDTWTNILGNASTSRNQKPVIMSRPSAFVECGCGEPHRQSKCPAAQRSTTRGEPNAVRLRKARAPGLTFEEIDGAGGLERSLPLTMRSSRGLPVGRMRRSGHSPSQPGTTTGGGQLTRRA
jgi:hypothetical protein